MQEDPPHVVIVAGPNGAGKTTTAPYLVRDLLGVSTYVNADVIAQDLGNADSPKTTLQAGRLMLERMHELSEAAESFAFETTLASRSFAPWLSRLKREQGYQVGLFFFSLRDADAAIARVRERVAHGGHDVSEDVIRRRFDRGLRNFFGLYSSVVDSWMFLDNSRPSGASLVAIQSLDGRMTVYDEKRWELAKR